MQKLENRWTIKQKDKQKSMEDIPYYLHFIRLKERNNEKVDFGRKGAHLNAWLMFCEYQSIFSIFTSMLTVFPSFPEGMGRE